MPKPLSFKGKGRRGALTNTGSQGVVGRAKPGRQAGPASQELSELQTEGRGKCKESGWYIQELQLISSRQPMAFGGSAISEPAIECGYEAGKSENSVVQARTTMVQHQTD